MERRRAVIVAATASLTLLAGTAAISLNTGIVGASGDDGVGQVSPVDASTPGTIDMDVPAPGHATTLPDGSTAQARGTPSTGDEDRYDDRDDDRDDDGSDDEGDDDGYRHEYEGADDDD
jgi:hypothetical protein